MWRRLLFGAALVCLACERRAPDDAVGTLLFVSDRSGIDALYTRQLPDGPDRRITHLSEPVQDPALSPDGHYAAFAVGGRIAVISLATGDVRYESLGVSGRDGTPAWHPLGRKLVITSRRAEGESADLFELSFGEGAAEAPRRRLLETPADESEPVFSPDGASVVFVREDNLYRLDLVEGGVRRITGGFRKVQKPRFLPSGRLLYVWSETKLFGIDSIASDGRDRRTLLQGSTCYRTVAPSPDGRYLVVTDAFDLGFRPAEALTRRRNEQLRLLDADGAVLGTLTEAWRHSSHSAVWGP